METKTMTTAHKILAEGLKSAAKQSAPTDSKTIADIIGKHQNTVIRYMGGDVRDFNTGSIVLTELKKLIKEREHLAKKLIA